MKNDFKWYQKEAIIDSVVMYHSLVNVRDGQKEKNRRYVFMFLFSVDGLGVLRRQ